MLYFEWLWSGDGAGLISIPGRPAYLDNSRARAYYSYSKGGWGLFGFIFSFPFISLFSSSLGDGSKILSQRAVI